MHNLAVNIQVKVIGRYFPALLFIVIQTAILLHGNGPTICVCCKVVARRNGYRLTAQQND